MATNCQFEGMQGKVLEAVAAFTQANEQVVGQLVELSSTAAREGLRAMGELQTAAMDAARAIPIACAATIGRVRSNAPSAAELRRCTAFSVPPSSAAEAGGGEPRSASRPFAIRSVRRCSPPSR